MKIKVYEYSGCGTCKKALKWLDENGIAYTRIPIREKPPTKQELKQMLNAVDGALRRLFNTSGRDYKQLNMKKRLPTMSTEEAIALLGKNGNLVKRPFVLGVKCRFVGFKQNEWRKALL